MGQPSITIKVDYKGTPHTFFGLSNGDGHSQHYGFVPQTPGSPIGPGKVGEGIATHAIGDPTNSTAGYIDDVAWEREIPITMAQYEGINNTIAEWKAAGFTYNVTGLFGENCTGFVKDVLASNGISYPGMSAGVNPLSLIPLGEQGPLFETGPDGRKSLSDAVRDPLNTPGTPAYEYKQAHPEMFTPQPEAPGTPDRSTSELHQNSDGSYTEKISQTGESAGDTTSIEYTPSGEVSEVTEIDGAGDNADYDSRTTTYDPAGRVDAVDVLRDDGSRDLTNRDQDSTQAWDHVDVHYDAQGRMDYSTTSMDDGGSIWSDADQTGARSDSLWQSGTDAQGRLDWVKATEDGGGFHWVDYDQANVNGTARWESRTDAEGRVDWMGAVMEDGSVSRVDYDEAAAQFWARIETGIDAQGRTDFSTVVADDGAQTWQDYDQESTRADSLYQVHTDAQGRTDWVNVTADDGGNRWVDYDQGDVNATARWESQTDAQGSIDWTNTAMDDGSRDFWDYDQSGTETWSRAETTFDAAGNKDYRVVYEDGGARAEYEYFPEVHPEAYALSYFYADGHGAGGRVTFDGYAHSLELVGGNNPEWPDSTIDFDFGYALEPYY